MKVHLTEVYALVPKLVDFLILSDCVPLPPKPYDSIRFLSSFSKNEPISPRILARHHPGMDYSLTVKVFFLQPRYFSYSQGIFLKAKVFFLYPRYFSFHCTFTSLGRFVSLTAAGPRRSHRSRTEGWPAISHSCDWDMPLALQLKKLNF